MKQINDNSLLDAGYAKTEESAELKQLWARMLQWKLPVAIIGTLVGFLGLVLATLLTLDSIRRVYSYDEIWDVGSRIYNMRLGELWISAAALFFAFILFVLFIGLFFSRKNASKYLSGLALDKVLPYQTGYWRMMTIGLGIGMLSLSATIAFSFYFVSRGSIDIIEETTQPAPRGFDTLARVNIEPNFSTSDTNFLAPVPVEEPISPVEVPTAEPELLKNSN